MAIMDDLIDDENAAKAALEDARASGIEADIAAADILVSAAANRRHGILRFRDGKIDEDKARYILNKTSRKYAAWDGKL